LANTWQTLDFMVKNDKQLGKPKNKQTRFDITSVKVNETIGKGIVYRPLVRDSISPIYIFDISFPNVPTKLKRYRGTTKMTDKNLAIQVFKQEAEKEYQHRLERSIIRPKLSTEKIIEEFIEDIAVKVEKQLPKKKGIWTQSNYNEHSRRARNHIAPYISHKPIEHINELDIEMWVGKLREEGQSFKNIANIRTTFNYLWEYARRRGYITKGGTPSFPTLNIKSEAKQFAFCSFEEFNEAIQVIDEELKRNDLTDLQRHKYFVFKNWMFLCADCGFRPYYLNHRPLKPSRRTDNTIFFAREEKLNQGVKPYQARGKKKSMEVVDELTAYYKSMKIKNEELIVGLDGKKFSKQSWEKLNQQIQKLIGWKGKVDEDGNSFAIYSIRHMHITLAIEGGEDVLSIANRVGTSVEMIYKTYYKWFQFKEKDIVSPFD